MGNNFTLYDGIYTKVQTSHELNNMFKYCKTIDDVVEIIMQNPEIDIQKEVRDIKTTKQHRYKKMLNEYCRTGYKYLELALEYKLLNILDFVDYYNDKNVYNNKNKSLKKAVDLQMNDFLKNIVIIMFNNPDKHKDNVKKFIGLSKFNEFDEIVENILINMHDLFCFAQLYEICLEINEERKYMHTNSYRSNIEYYFEQKICEIYKTDKNCIKELLEIVQSSMPKTTVFLRSCILLLA